MSATGYQHKDRLFKFIFGNPEKREWTLSLYNAINGSHYTNPEDIEFNTIEDAVYLGMKNDVSFIVVMSEMNLWEHQSSFNPNMPVRFLIYAGQLYDKYLTEQNVHRYSRKLYRLPVPRCVCFYNGTDDQPAEKMLRLSDAFNADASDPSIEVKVRMLNINYGENARLMKFCEPLEGYAWLVETIRRNQKVMGSLEAAVDAALDAMPDHFEIKDFLRAHRAEVKGMYLSEYNAERDREEGLAEGRAEGRELGLAEGIKENQKATAMNMLKKKLPLSLISEISTLPEDVLRELADSLGISVV